MYDIKSLVERENSLKQHFKMHFVDFFTGYDYEDRSDDNIKITNIHSYNDISSLRYGSGLYLILTNYLIQENPCRLEVNGLKVIYRGHGIRIRKRVESHLFNLQYNENKDRTTYSVCMKLNDDNGINIDRDPYSEYQWTVIQHPMTNSSKTMREQAEQAFDHVYLRPIGSNA